MFKLNLKVNSHTLSRDEMKQVIGGVLSDDGAGCSVQTCYNDSMCPSECECHRVVEGCFGKVAPPPLPPPPPPPPIPA
jgi:hypothetical protein